MKNTHKIAVTLGLMIVATAGLYAAGQQITSLTQTVGEGDIMTAAYYNKLNGPKSEGKVCKFVTDKMVCLDDMPLNTSSSSTGGGGGGGGGVTTPMNKTLYTSPHTGDNLTTVELQENVDAWNAMRDEIIEGRKATYGENSAFMQDILKPGGWKDACTMSNTTFNIPNTSVAAFDRCGGNICGMKHGASVQSTTQCGTGSPVCFRGTWHLVCMY